MAAGVRRLPEAMPRLATTGRPPILASLCLLGAVVSLRPAPPPSLELHTTEIVAGIPRGDLYEAPSGIDPWILQAPRGGTVAMPNAVLPHDLVWRPKARPLAMDQLVSGFLRLFAGD